MKKITAKLVEATRSMGTILYSVELVYPRIIHAELLTHRVLTRNSSSSRAVPFLKNIAVLDDNIFIPEKWMKSHKGMQGNEFILDPEKIDKIRKIWINMAKTTIEGCRQLHELGVSKQYTNRPMEWFNHIKVLITGTKEGILSFLKLRLDPSVEIHMQELAARIKEATIGNLKVPKMLKQKKIIHAPYTEDLTFGALRHLYNRNKAAVDSMMDGVEDLNSIQFLKMMISAARCARVSYTVIGEEGKERPLDADFKLALRLFKDRHSSPFEHQAKCIPLTECSVDKSRNFTASSGFYQFRSMIEKKGLSAQVTALHKAIVRAELVEANKEEESVIIFMDAQDTWQYSASFDGFKDLYKMAYKPHEPTILIPLNKLEGISSSTDENVLREVLKTFI